MFHCYEYLCSDQRATIQRDEHAHPRYVDEYQFQLCAHLTQEKQRTLVPPHRATSPSPPPSTSQNRPSNSSHRNIIRTLLMGITLTRAATPAGNSLPAATSTSRRRDHLILPLQQRHERHQLLDAVRIVQDPQRSYPVRKGVCESFLGVDKMRPRPRGAAHEEVGC